LDSAGFVTEQKDVNNVSQNDDISERFFIGGQDAAEEIYNQFKALIYCIFERVGSSCNIGKILLVSFD
jgi:hypothetical protein